MQWGRNGTPKHNGAITGWDSIVHYGDLHAMGPRWDPKVQWGCEDMMGPQHVMGMLWDP